MSESIYLVLIPVVLYAATRCLDDPGRWWFALLGLAIGAAILNRSEAVGLVVLIGVPTVWRATAGLRMRVQAGAIVMVAVLVLVGPWLIRNVREIGAAKLSTNSGNMIGAYCSETFARGPRFGTYFIGCPFSETLKLIYGPPPHGAKAWTPVALDDELGSKALDFARSHVSQLPAIGAVHVLRIWGFWDPPVEMKYDIDEGRNAVVQRVGWGVHYALLVFALVWLVEVPGDERRRWAPVLALVVLVTLSAMVFYGSTRLRAAAEPSIALAAAAGFGVVADRWRRYRGLDTGDVHHPRSDGPHSAFVERGRIG